MAFGIYGMCLIYGENKKGLKLTLTTSGWQVIEFTVWIRLIPAISVILFITIALILVCVGMSAGRVQ